MFKKNDLVEYIGFNKDNGAPDLPKGTLATIRTVHSGGMALTLNFIEDESRSEAKKRDFYEWENNYYFPVENFKCITHWRE